MVGCGSGSSSSVEKKGRKEKEPRGFDFK
jgi:hypothetical protein